ncbi:MAG: hypothetical protein SVY53_05175 [Chloroflexota bacterium]|nr:hypothetical protein [Chloroflexota bacterium]
MNLKLKQAIEEYKDKLSRFCRGENINFGEISDGVAKVLLEEDLRGSRIWVLYGDSIGYGVIEQVLEYSWTDRSGLLVDVELNGICLRISQHCLFSSANEALEMLLFSLGNGGVGYD